MEVEYLKLMDLKKMNEKSRTHYIKLARESNLEVISEKALQIDFYYFEYCQLDIKENTLKLKSILEDKITKTIIHLVRQTNKFEYDVDVSFEQVDSETPNKFDFHVSIHVYFKSKQKWHPKIQIKYIKSNIDYEYHPFYFATLNSSNEFINEIEKINDEDFLVFAEIKNTWKDFVNKYEQTFKTKVFAKDHEIYDFNKKIHTLFRKFIDEGKRPLDENSYSEFTIRYLLGKDIRFHYELEVSSVYFGGFPKISPEYYVLVDEKVLIKDVINGLATAKVIHQELADDYNTHEDISLFFELKKLLGY